MKRATLKRVKWAASVGAGLNLNGPDVKDIRDSDRRQAAELRRKNDALRAIQAALLDDEDRGLALFRARALTAAALKPARRKP